LNKNLNVFLYDLLTFEPSYNHVDNCKLSEATGGKGGDRYITIKIRVGKHKYYSDLVLQVKLLYFALS